LPINPNALALHSSKSKKKQKKNNSPPSTRQGKPDTLLLASFRYFNDIWETIQQAPRSNTLQTVSTPIKWQN